MSLVVFENVALAFGKKTIVKDLSLRIAAGDRIGLVGPNGSGKTSILRLVAGEQQPDYGEVRKANGIRIGYLPQDLAVEGGKPLLDFVVQSVPGRAELDRTVGEVETELARATERGDEEATMAAAERLAALHEKQVHFDMHYSEHQAKSILAGLGFVESDHGRDLGELSGGWKMRAVLAGLLYQRPDVLLLDEPTNHLDMPSVAWFGGFLRQYDGAFVLICHDREFLNEQIARTVSFEPEGVRQYPGNYEKYLVARAEEEVILENKAKNLAREREKTERFIERFRAKNTKASAVQSRIKKLEKMEKVDLHQDRRTMRFSFPPAQRAGNEAVATHGLGKAYGTNRVLSGVDLSVLRGEKIGIIGVNGAGKTTLLRIMAGEIPATEGSVELGHNVKVSYYAQHHADVLDRDKTVFEEVYGHSKDAGMTRVRSLLGALLFSGDDVEKHVKVLSGGERARVALAKMLVDPGNVLMMDEPTNHLDLESSEALAEALASFDGTLIFVSHNRSFVRRLASKIWNVADGTVRVYPGTLDEYMESAQRKLDEGDGAAAGPSAGKPANDGDGRAKASKADEKERKRREAAERQRRASKLGPLQKKNAELEGRIAELEAEQKKRNEELEKPEVYGDDSRRFQILAEMQTTHEKIEELTARWMGVQEELEQAEAELARTDGA